MYGYMTDLDTVHPCEECACEIEVEGVWRNLLAKGGTPLLHVALLLCSHLCCRLTGRDILSLLFNFLDELLFKFATEDLIGKSVQVSSITHGTCEAPDPVTANDDADASTASGDVAVPWKLTAAMYVHLRKGAVRCPALRVHARTHSVARLTATAALVSGSHSASIHKALKSKLSHTATCKCGATANPAKTCISMSL